LGDGIRLKGPRELTAFVWNGFFPLVTANVEVGGADGVKSGYFEVELTQDTKDKSLNFQVGMFRPGLDHSSVVPYEPGDGWALIASSGGRCNYNGVGADRQGQLKVGDRVGVLVDLEEKEGRQGGSIQFFVNGAKFGSGFESGVISPLVFGVRMGGEGQNATLLPDAQRPAGF
jgi:hypothetical protein